EAEQRASTRLAQLMKALERDEPSDDEQAGESEGEGNDGDGPSLAETLQRLAELKLLRLMQEEINRQTVDLDQQRQKNGELSDSELDTLNELSREQGRLAELILEFEQ
ncbi:MAG: hypothetical protein JJ992_01260, partial [Planctomycetes bacterium]|nr:hypothetical protein [Planctomycetota bacterium]